MSVSGKSSVTYSYDNANRLTQITQGTASVAIGHDVDGRRTALTLPNGVVATYGYDVASQLNAITYSLGSTTLGNLTYSCDLAGRRTTVGGTFARSGVPNAVSSANYNVNNQLTQFGASNLTYDANGNLISDGTNTYTWNARNQLVSISGRVAASFQYDPFGRRVSKTIGGTTQILYDGANPVQEISGTLASANLLTGGIDEYFQRTDSAGVRNFLTDALGSTLALTDSTGTIQTSYTIEPFGNTTVNGATTTSSFAYTGRELDATGLYFYRGRYYNTSLQRFISEDPIGFNGGDVNLYAYTRNSPLNFRDPSGLDVDFWNNPIMDFISNHANELPGICGGGAFLYYGGGPQVGTENAAVYGGNYAFHNVSFDFKDILHPKAHVDPVADLAELGLETHAGEAGYGVIVGRKGPQEQLIYVGKKVGPAVVGPIVGASTEHGWNPLYNDRYIGVFGEVSGHFVPGASLFRSQAGIGGGLYLTVQPASACVR
jgi:RHS repeat-associated protein